MTEEDTKASARTEIVLPKFGNWDSKKLYDYTQTIYDYESFEDLEDVLMQLRKSLFVINDKINEYERKERLAKIEYDRKHRREYLLSTEKTEAAKKARADLMCEELENKWLRNEQLKSEMIRTSYTLKTELQTLTTIAHNMRAQMKSF